MCLVLIAHNSNPDYKLILIANRDEFHSRPSKTLHNWKENSNIWGGRDLESGGTWLGVSKSGRIATVTNVRKGDIAGIALRSRGLLVSDFLKTTLSMKIFTDTLIDNAATYAGYNLLTFDGSNLTWVNNTTRAAKMLSPGVYTLSNAKLHTAWPKTERLKRNFETCLSTGSNNFTAALFAILRDEKKAPDEDLPKTGVDKKLEKTLSSIFIKGEHYGTKCSSIITINNADLLNFHERTYDQQGCVVENSHFCFQLKQQ